MKTKDVEIKVLNEESLGDNQDLQGVIDLYKKHDFGEEEKKSRGIDSVENLQYEIQNISQFIIAKKGEKIIGARRLTFDPIVENNEFKILSNALFVDPKFHRQGIASLIEHETLKYLQENIKTKINGVLTLSGGIDPKNTKSIEFHKKMGWEKEDDAILQLDADGNEHQYEWWKKEV
jgi:RimJ/RimL family protein N-acetyltransferase